jgi:amino acid transporter
LPLIALYGLGTIVGGGFYALLGKVAGHAGIYAPISFGLAAAIGCFSALSYGELAARYPDSGGESFYVLAAFRQRWLSNVVGLLVIATGVVSAATLSSAFVGFLQELVDVPTAIATVTIVVAMAGVAIWGISESAFLAVSITFIEIGTLVYIGMSESSHLPDLAALGEAMLPPMSGDAWKGIALGSFLAFYAFIGFEDMVNVAEEVQSPRRNLPLAILLALGISAVLYMTVSTVAVFAVAPGELAASRAPLATIVGGTNRFSGVGITLVSMLAGVNGALVQLIMASRIIYSMARRGKLGHRLSKVNERTRTPVEATVIVSAVALALALWYPLVSLARLTSGIILLVFAMVNLALIVVRRRDGNTRPDLPVRPIGIPVMGFVTSLGLLGLQVIWSS